MEEFDDTTIGRWRVRVNGYPYQHKYRVCLWPLDEDSGRAKYRFWTTPFGAILGIPRGLLTPEEDRAIHQVVSWCRAENCWDY